MPTQLDVKVFRLARFGKKGAPVPVFHRSDTVERPPIAPEVEIAFGARVGGSVGADGTSGRLECVQPHPHDPHASVLTIISWKEGVR